MSQNKNQPDKKKMGASMDPQETYDAYEIHPRIGIARLGVSHHAFLAPEPDCKQAQFDDTGSSRAGALPVPAITARNREARWMWQAVRFRVFKVTARQADKNKSCPAMNYA